MTSATAPLARLTAADVDALAAGAILLGSGGGGEVGVGQMLLRRMLARRPVEVVAAADLPDDALVVHIGLGGSPDVLTERLINPADLAIAVRTVVAHLDERLSAVGIIEIGGMNALVGVHAAAELGVPVVDGDLMGRAYPHLVMTTLALVGHPMTPMAIADPAGDVVLIPNSPPERANKLMIANMGAMGGAAAIASYPTRAAVLRAAGIGGSLSTCVALGETFLDGRGLGAAEIVGRLGGRLLVDGRIDEQRPPGVPPYGGAGRAAPGSVTLADRNGAGARIDHVEEFVAVAVDGVTVAASPEVLVVLDHSTGTPLRTDQLRIGQPVVVGALPQLHAWPADADPLVGPAAFGIEVERS